ncbi:MAG TPA: nuclear transport factor 2 family protein [Anaerolineae bacterium]|jgi:hypothetical protein|nr:nuclear transport factor 2 family protein [Anaerolineae bacterium]
MDEKRKLSLQLWHSIVLDKRLDILGDVLAEDVVFRSPFLWKPYHGRYPAFVILGAVSDVFRDFAYHRELVVGNIWVLEFSAMVGELSVKGIDLIELNDEGLIQNLEVFVRPANGLLALGEAMKRRLSEIGFS